MSYPGAEFNYTTNGVNISLYDTFASDGNYDPGNSPSSGPGPVNGTIIANTAMNLRLNDYNFS
jgi:hypothetical protein